MLIDYQKANIYQTDEVILQNVYFHVDEEQFVYVIGKVGSGKSSLLKIIAGIDKDYQGEVVFSPGFTVGYLEQEP